jgi:hypothetical protein
MRKVLLLLGQLTDTDAEWLIRNGRKIFVPKGDTLIEAGRQPTALFLVLDGELGVLARSPASARDRRRAQPPRHPLPLCRRARAGA